METTRRALIAAGLAALLACGSPDARGGRGEGPRRILALAPAVAEIAYALDLGERVVGVGDYVRWPPEWADKPRLGGLFNPQLERIAALAPDLAILLPSEEALAERLRDLDIEVLTVPTETLGDVELAVGEIARRCGVPEAGERLLRQWRTELAPAPLPEPLSAVLVVGREPGELGEIVVAGRGTFFDELLRRLGADNAFAGAPGRYPQVSAEQIVLARPDAIIDLQPLDVPWTRVEALQRDWQALAVVPAVARGCVPVVGGEHVLIPGPRLPRLYGELRAALADCLATPLPPPATPPPAAP